MGKLFNKNWGKWKTYPGSNLKTRVSKDGIWTECHCAKHGRAMFSNSDTSLKRLRGWIQIHGQH